jgi:23S rRNA (adenine2030-N6)-methyltransferase
MLPASTIKVVPRFSMNYRHAFHAGNFADVLKHIALTAVILHLRRKEKAFCAIDTHAGAGLYQLGSEEARRTGEAGQGIARILDLAGSEEIPKAVAAYLACVTQEGGDCYPGSARILARLLRPQDRLIAIEKHPGEASSLRSALAEFSNARVVQGDGYERLPALLPPSERRGVVLIDPPYEAGDEFERAVDLLAGAHRRFATGICLLWFPSSRKSQPTRSAAKSAHAWLRHSCGSTSMSADLAMRRRSACLPRDCWCSTRHLDSNPKWAPRPRPLLLSSAVRRTNRP